MGLSHIQLGIKRSSLLYFSLVLDTFAPATIASNTSASVEHRSYSKIWNEYYTDYLPRLFLLLTDRLQSSQQHSKQNPLQKEAYVSNTSNSSTNTSSNNNNKLLSAASQTEKQNIQTKILLLQCLEKYLHCADPIQLYKSTTHINTKTSNTTTTAITSLNTSSSTTLTDTSDSSQYYQSSLHHLFYPLSDTNTSSSSSSLLLVHKTETSTPIAQSKQQYKSMKFKAANQTNYNTTITSSSTSSSSSESPSVLQLFIRQSIPVLIEYWLEALSTHHHSSNLIPTTEALIQMHSIVHIIHMLFLLLQSELKQEQIRRRLLDPSNQTTTSTTTSSTLMDELQLYTPYLKEILAHIYVHFPLTTESLSTSCTSSLPTIYSAVFAITSPLSSTFLSTSSSLSHVLTTINLSISQLMSFFWNNTTTTMKSLTSSSSSSSSSTVSTRKKSSAVQEQLDNLQQDLQSIIHYIIDCFTALAHAAQNKTLQQQQQQHQQASQSEQSDKNELMTDVNEAETSVSSASKSKTKRKGQAQPSTTSSSSSSSSTADDNTPTILPSSLTDLLPLLYHLLPRVSSPIQVQLLSSFTTYYESCSALSHHKYTCLCFLRQLIVLRGSTYYYDERMNDSSSTPELYELGYRWFYSLPTYLYECGARLPHVSQQIILFLHLLIKQYSANNETRTNSSSTSLSSSSSSSASSTSSSSSWFDPAVFQESIIPFFYTTSKFHENGTEVKHRYKLHFQV